MHRHAVVLHGFGQMRQKRLAVGIIRKHSLPTHAAHQHMVGLTGDAQTGQAGHGG
jgi:hypothetical protein